MSLILCIESGTDVCSVGIAKDGELVSLRESSEGRDHARNVALFADELFEQCSLRAEDFDAIAVGMGPGSYTGLRIGVSFAKGLCYGLNKPLIAIGSLNMLAELAIENHSAGVLNIENWEQARLCTMIDARRMEVYTQIFDTEGVALNEVSAKVIDEESFAEYNDGKPFIILGNGAAKCAELLPWAQYIDVAPSASGYARLAQKCFDGEEFVDVAYFEPLYLKDFIVTTSKKKLF